MAAASKEIDFSELEKRLNGMAMVGVNLDPLFKRIFVAMAAETKRRFVTSTAPDGTPWAPLVLRKGGKPLWDTGSHLMASCTVAAGGKDAIRETSGRGCRFGSSWEYASVHNDGSTITPKNGPFLVVPDPPGKPTRFLMLKEAVIPKREFLGFNEPMMDAIDDLVADYAIEKLGGG